MLYHEFLMLCPVRLQMRDKRCHLRTHKGQAGQSTGHHFQEQELLVLVELLEESSLSSLHLE